MANTGWLPLAGKPIEHAPTYGVYAELSRGCSAEFAKDMKLVCSKCKMISFLLLSADRAKLALGGVLSGQEGLLIWRAGELRTAGQEMRKTSGSGLDNICAVVYGEIAEPV
jgi:hypothetical protein